jgi:hypothetical protein
VTIIHRFQDANGRDFPGHFFVREVRIMRAAEIRAIARCAVMTRRKNLQRAENFLHHFHSRHIYYLNHVAVYQRF